MSDLIDACWLSHQIHYDQQDGRTVQDYLPDHDSFELSGHSDISVCDEEEIIHLAMTGARRPNRFIEDLESLLQ
nr:hypothetical protein CFP56_74590 [Quercus suber]